MLNLKELRKKRKLTQADLAEIIGVSQVTMGRYETGEREMPYETLFRLADYFNVSIDEILGRPPVPVTIVHEPPPPETPPGMKRMVLKFDSDGADPDGKEPATFEQRVAEILEKELKKRGL